MKIGNIFNIFLLQQKGTEFYYDNYCVYTKEYSKLNQKVNVCKEFTAPYFNEFQ